MPYESTLRPGIFAGRKIIVTGGGSGIGRCTAHELTSLGAEVVLIGRTQEKLDRVAGEIAEDGGHATTHALDIREEDAVVACIGAVCAEGKIDGLVNNAGGQFPSPLEAISKNGFDSVVRNNLTGGFLMSREVFKQSMKEHGGAIVHITADNRNGMPGMGHSGAARAGVENLTMTQAWEWGCNGVRVNSVAPGWVESSGFDTYDSGMRAMVRQLRNYVPLKRIATEAEISSVICFLLSDGANFISGQTLRVDGAASLGSTSQLWPLPDEATNSESYQGFHRAETPQALLEGDEEAS